MWETNTALLRTPTAGTVSPSRIADMAFVLFCTAAWAVLALSFGYAAALHVQFTTLPLRGHWAPLTGLIEEALARNHTVSLALCEQSHPWASPYVALGARIVSLGACPKMNEADEVIARLINAPDDFSVIQDMLKGMADASAEAGTEHLAQVACASDARPDVLVYDADSPYGAHVGARMGIPRVARLATGLRHPRLTPWSLPIFGSKIPAQEYQYVHLPSAGMASVHMSAWIADASCLACCRPSTSCSLVSSCNPCMTTRWHTGIALRYLHKLRGPAGMVARLRSLARRPILGW